MKKILKDWYKSLFPFRWIIPVMFIFLMSMVIWMGFTVPIPEGTEREYFTNPYVWYGGNIIGWTILDIFFGLGRVGPTFKYKDKL